MVTNDAEFSKELVYVHMHGTIGLLSDSDFDLIDLVLLGGVVGYWIYLDWEFWEWIWGFGIGYGALG